MLTFNVANIIPANSVMNTIIQSQALQLENMYGFSIQVVFTGTPNGVFTLQASCDPVPRQRETLNANGTPAFTPTNWTEVEDSDFTVSSAGSVFWNYAQNVNWCYVRVVYTPTTSTAAVITSARFNGKGM